MRAVCPHVASPPGVHLPLLGIIWRERAANHVVFYRLAFSLFVGVRLTKPMRCYCSFLLYVSFDTLLSLTTASRCSSE